MAQQARTVEEYVEWIEQAVFEVGDLRDCLEYYLDEQGKYPAFLDPLEKGIKEMFASMKDGTYQWGTEDLAFLTLARKHASDVPFIYLLDRINATHRKGLDVPEEG
ncbi:MAG: general secretion pathway protein GspF [Methylococcales bacterium]|jgi:hypothetical protein|nr:general secretion pathway protein GspF [Methylococcales bacterium]MBT7444537.1 general secretion pathway protein GspF [Methylococcales bacterium]